MILNIFLTDIKIRLHRHSKIQGMIKNVLRFYEFLSKYPSGNQFLSKSKNIDRKNVIFLKGRKHVLIRSMRLYGDNMETMND